MDEQVPREREELTFHLISCEPSVVQPDELVGAVIWIAETTSTKSGARRMASMARFCDCAGRVG